MTLISIIMPAYNAANFIEESIHSAQAQTYKHWELIVVDDGSTDNTADIVKKMAAIDERIVYIYQTNQRLGAARNTGIKAAKGEWLAFLDSDDLWMPKKLELQLAAAANYNADVVFSNGFNLLHESKKLTPYPCVQGLFSGLEMYKLLNATNVIPVLAVLMKKLLIDVVGLQDTDVKAWGCEDWDYWLRIAKSGATFYGLERELFKYRVHNNGMSQNRLRMQMAECYVIYKNLDFEYLKSNEINEVKKKLQNLVEAIIPLLYKSGEIKFITYYLNIPIQLSKSLNFSFALALFNQLKAKSKWLVIPLLHNNLSGIKKISRKIKSLQKKLLTRYNPPDKSKYIRQLSTSKHSFVHESTAIEAPFVFHHFGDDYMLEINNGVQFRSFCNILLYPKAKLIIGKNVFFNNYCSINCLEGITIGDNTLLGEGVKIYDHNHEYYYNRQILNVERNKFTTAAVNIGKNCWIGSNVTILKGVTIGDNVIIGAGNLIYKSIPSNKIVKLKSEAIIQDL